MSYIFQSHQLHPRHCSLGMGLIGPDQPWTKENAGKQLVPRAEPCNAATHKLTKGSEYYVPKTTIEGRVVDDTGCFKTGRIWEANRPGGVRYAEWCCEKKAPLPQRNLTAPEMQQYGELCGLTRNPTTGEVVILQYGEKTPRWVPFDAYVGSTCSNPGITDGGYKLICCPLKDPDRVLKLPDTQFATPTVTPEQVIQEQAAVEQAAAARQQQIESQMIEQPSLLERYGLATFFVLGTIGIGVTAALFKRFKVASKQAKEAKEAAQAIQNNPEDQEKKLDPALYTEKKGNSWDVYWVNPWNGKTDFIGKVKEPKLKEYIAESICCGCEGVFGTVAEAARCLADVSSRVTGDDYQRLVSSLGSKNNPKKNSGSRPPKAVGDRWDGPPLLPGPELELVDLGGDRWEVYWRCPETGRRDYLGFIEDTRSGRYRYQASSPRGHSGTHQNLNDAATWLAQRALRVLRGEK